MDYFYYWSIAYRIIFLGRVRGYLHNCKHTCRSTETQLCRIENPGPAQAVFSRSRESTGEGKHLDSIDEIKRRFLLLILPARDRAQTSAESLPIAILSPTTVVWHNAIFSQTISTGAARPAALHPTRRPEHATRPGNLDAAHETRHADADPAPRFQLPRHFSNRRRR